MLTVYTWAGSPGALEVWAFEACQEKRDHGGGDAQRFALMRMDLAA